MTKFEMAHKRLDEIEALANSAATPAATRLEWRIQIELVRALVDIGDTLDDIRVSIPS